MSASGSGGLESLEDRVLLSATRVTDVLGTAGSGPLFLSGTPGGVTYFSAGANQLWKTDGTDAGTVMLKDFGASGGFGPREMMVLGSQVFFSGGTAAGGRELWKTDGTAAGTVQVMDIRPGTASSLVQRLTVYGDRVYFIADNGTNGLELWSSDGTDDGTALVKDINPGSAASTPGDMTNLGGLLYFAANRWGEWF